MPLQPGDILNDRYLIQDIIAQGGMGAIYRAFDQALNLQVALKENFHDTDQFSRQFHREAAMLAALNHPNLPRVTDHFITTGGGQYLVMDYIEGEDLRQVLARQNTLPETEVIRIGAQVCEALEYLHTRQPPIVHRDVKPGNVKITPGGQVFLVDFGLAKKYSGGEATTTGAQALTPGYAPPEQYGQGTEPRSDIYALGATLYAALTGQIPVDGLSRAMGSADLAPIRATSPLVSLHTSAALEKAMAIRPADRFETAIEFRAALISSSPAAQSTGKYAPPAQRLESISPLEPTLARPDKSPHPTGPLPHPPAPLPPAASSSNPDRPIRTGSWIILGAAGILILILAIVFALPGLAGASRLMTPSLTKTFSPAIPTPTAAVAIVSTPTSLPTPSTSPSLEATSLPEVPRPTDTPQPSPTAALPTPTPRGGASWIAFSSNRGGSTQIWLASPDTDEFVQVTNLPDGACQPDWAPDGKRLVFISPCSGRKDIYPGASLYIIRSDGTGLIPLVSIPGGDFDPAWSPDGASIAFTSLRSGKPCIYIYDLAANTVRLVSNPVNYERRPAWSPDGKWIAYETTLTGQTQIWVMDSAGKNKTELSPSSSGISRMASWAQDGSFILYSQGGDMPVLMSRAFPARGSPEFRLAETFTGVEDARVSPDGWQIALTLYDRAGTCDIYIVARNGAAVTRLTNTNAQNFHPAWQP
jgi:eukaryotic-like serine/threonine-protein kinase